MALPTRRPFWDQSVRQALDAALADDRALSDTDIHDILISTLDGEGVTKQEFENLQRILERSRTISTNGRQMIQRFVRERYRPPTVSHAPIPTQPNQLTSNFTLAEFACKDGASVPRDLQDNVLTLARNLQVLRDQIGVPIRINSAYRTPEHNAKRGGVPNSQHLLAKAADIAVRGLKPAQVASQIETLIEAGKMQQGGIGRYNTFVHYDVRGTRARWAV